jgi:hypothetical protein
VPVCGRVERTGLRGHITSRRQQRPAHPDASEKQQGDGAAQEDVVKATHGVLPLEPTVYDASATRVVAVPKGAITRGAVAIVMAT